MVRTKTIACSVRPAEKEDEVKNLWRSLSSELGWNRLPEDATTHIYSSGLGNWLMTIPKTTPSDEAYPADGAPQGCIAAFKYPNGTGWLGFFVLTAPYRYYGMGRELFQAAMDSFHHASTTEGGSEFKYIGLDGVPEQKESYARRGFVETGLITVCTRPNARDIPAAAATVEAAEEEEELVDLKAVSREILVESDLAHSGFERPRLWTDEALFHRTDATGWAIRDTNSKDIKGWILVRQSELGYRIGPLYATRKDVASRLLHTAMSNLDDKDVSLVAETWPQNKQAVETFDELGWKPVGNYHRMWYEGRVPPAQAQGGRAETDTFAIFDAVEG